VNRILILIPPRHEGRWVSREYKDGYYDLPHPPYLMLSVAALLRREHPQVELHFLDAQLEGLDIEGVRERVTALAPDLIVCSLGTISIRADAACLELPFPTIGVMQAWLDKPEGIAKYDLKALCYTDREMEHTVAEAARELFSTGRIEATRGLYLRRGPEVVFTGAREVDSLAELPRPLFELADPRRYLDIQQAESGTSYAFLFTARGCPFGCTFCAPPGTGYRKVLYKGPEQVVDEIAFLRERFGLTRFYFMDDEFASDMERAKEICRRLISRAPGISFVVYNSVQLVDEELMALLARAGCTLVRYGVETADDAIQRATRKNLRREQIVRAFRLTREAGLLTDAFFMVGFPGETRATLAANLRLIRDLSPDRVTLGILFPKPYSQMYYELRAAGGLLTDDWSQLYPGRPCLKGEGCASPREVVEAMRWLARRADRFISFRDIFSGRTGRNLYSRVGRFLMTIEPLRRLAHSQGWLEALLRRPYRAPRKLEI